MSIAPTELERDLEPPVAGSEDGGYAAIEGRSLGHLAWRQLKSDKVAVGGGITAVVLIILGFGAPLITSWYGQNITAPHYDLVDAGTQLPIGSYGGISGTHWLGVTPVLGQDIFAQILYGLRTSLTIGLLATLFSLVFGISLGLIAGYYRGKVDTVIARLMDLLLSFPSLLFAIALVTVVNLQPSTFGLSGVVRQYAVIVFVLGFFGFPYIGRIVRGQVLSLREKEFVEAARSLGASDYRIISKEILPNVIGPILVYTTLTIPNYILGEAGLSYLGAGIQPPSVSLGGLLSTSQGFFQVDATFLLAPGLTIFILVLAFNLFGDGLRDAIDPKSKR